MHGAQGTPLASTALSVGPSLAEQEQTAVAAELPRCAACEARRAEELPLHFGVASLEHWLDLNA